MSLKHDLQYAVDLARGAGRIVMDHFGRVERLTKRNAEAVTPADRASQRFIVAGLRQRFPGDGIIGEESDKGDAITFECPNPAGRVWVIDPIDGTNNFIAGFENFAVCIGLLEAGRPVLGVVLDVTRDRVYRAAAGEGAWLDDERLWAIKTPLDAATLLMLTSNLAGRDGKPPAYVGRWLSQNTWKVRIMGSAALEAAEVAAGVAHAAITTNGKLWDLAAPAALVLEAGGIITDHQGAAIFPFNLTNYDGAKVPFVAAGPGSHREVLDELAR